MAKSGKKKSSKKTTKIFFYSTIIANILKEKKLPTEKQFGGSKQKRNYYVKTLKERQIIKNLSNGVWVCDSHLAEDFLRNLRKKKPKRFEFVATASGKNTTKDFSGKYRVHNLMFRLLLPKFDYWGRRKKYMEKKGIPFKDIHHGSKQRVLHDGVTFHLCRDCIIFYCPEAVNLYCADHKDSERVARAWAQSTLKSFQNWFGIDFKIKGSWIVTIERSHVAAVNSDVAKDYNQRDDKLMVAENGKIWALVDRSLKTDEFEYVDGKKSFDDANNIEPNLNLLRKNPNMLIDITKSMNEVVKALEMQKKINEHLLEKQSKEDAVRRWSL